MGNHRLPGSTESEAEDLENRMRNQESVTESVSEGNDPAEIQIGSGPPTHAENGRKYQKLDPKVVSIWKFENLLSNSMLFVFTAAGSTVLGIFTGFPRFLVPVVWLVFGGFLFINSFWWPPRLFKSWSYRLDHKVIELKHGVFWQKSVLIPLSRVQHIDLLQGPLERRFGLASLEIHTAGTHHATHKLPGLKSETAKTLRETLAFFPLTDL